MTPVPLRNSITSRHVSCLVPLPGHSEFAAGKPLNFAAALQTPDSLTSQKPSFGSPRKLGSG